MRLRTFVGFAALLLLTAACSSGRGSSGDISEALDPNTEPVTATTNVDNSRAVSGMIGPAGGSLTATGADGSRYVLEVPADALVVDTEITMTPIESMEGLPLEDGLAAGVQLEPEGATFYDFVTLTIEPAEAIPVEQQMPIGSSGDTGAVYLPLIDLDPEIVRLRLTHFSSAGLSRGLLSDLEPVRQRLGGDVEARIFSLMSAEMVRARQAGESGPDMGAMEYLFTLYRDHVIKPRVAAAGESCAAGRLAIQTVLSYGRQRQLMGLPEESLAEVVDLMPTMARVCLQEEYELCRDEHIVHRMIPSILTMERQRQLLGIVSAEMDQVMAAAEDLAAKCLRFELEFKSSAELPTGDGGHVTSEVESKVTLQYEAGSLTPPRGSSALVNTNFEVVIPPGGCTATPARGGGTFTVVALNWLAASSGVEDQVGHIDDIVLRFDPGQTSETFTTQCPFGGRMGDLPISAWWSTFFLSTHSTEAADAGPIGQATGGLDLPDLSSVTSVTFLATGWDVSGGELFAEKEWDTSVGGISEEGSFKLYHRPQ